MLKRAVAFVVSAVTLVGCGGGGGSGDAQDSGGGPDQPSFPITYAGNTEPASLTQETAGVFFRYLLSDDGTASVTDNSSIFRSLQALPDGNKLFSANAVRETVGRSIPTGVRPIRALVNIDDTVKCPHSGDVTFRGAINEIEGTGEITAVYRNCGETGAVSDGEMRFVFETAPTDGPWKEFIDISTSGFVITSPAGRISLMGSARMADSGSCLFETTENFLIRDDQTGTVIRTENLVTLEDECLTLSPFAVTSFSGRVYHPEHGFVDIATPTAIGFAWDPSSIPNATGEIIMTGAQDSAVRLVIEVPAGLNAYEDPISTATVSFDVDGDASPESFVKFSASAVQQGAVFDMGDSDGDGLLNQWERIYQLNPNDAADAALDQDGDRFSSLVEAAYLTNPSDSGDIPPWTDTSVVVHGMLWDFPPVSEELWFSIQASGTTGGGIGEPITYVLSKSANSNWGETPYCSPDAADSGRLLCRMSPRAPPQLSIIAPDTVGEEFWVQAEVASAQLDPNPANNTARLSATTIERRSDAYVSIYTPITGGGPGLVGVPYQFDAVVGVVSDSNGALNTLMRISFPPEIVLDSITGAGQDYVCVGDRTVICEIGEVATGSTPTLYVVVRSTSPGTFPISIEVSSTGLDENLANNMATAQFAFGIESGVIQAMIEAAQPADTITVPNGIYVGALDFRGKNLHLAGKGADTQLSGEISMGPNSSLSNFHFLERTVIVVQRGARIENNTFVATGGIRSARVDSPTGPIMVTASDVVVARNKFLSASFPITLATDSVRIENNIIVGDYSGFGTAIFLKYPAPAANPGPIVVQNNTIVRGQDGPYWAYGVSLRGAGFDPSAIDIKNNIFSNVSWGIDVESTGGAQVRAVNNLFFESAPQRPSPFVTGVVTENDIQADPKFVNAAQNNYRLKSTSPAIDAGLGTNAPANDITGRARPVDGNGDGAAAWDIGAYEFVP